MQYLILKKLKGLHRTSDCGCSALWSIFEPQPSRMLSHWFQVHWRASATICAKIEPKACQMFFHHHCFNTIYIFEFLSCNKSIAVRWYKILSLIRRIDWRTLFGWVRGYARWNCVWFHRKKWWKPTFLDAHIFALSSRTLIVLSNPSSWRKEI